MSGPDIPKLRVRYAQLMTEIRARHEVIKGVYKESKRLPGFASRELVYLQLRMICELIGLACLTAHGDMPNVMTKNMHDAWEPGKILKHLETLNPLFYPIPVEQKLDKDGVLEGVHPIKNNLLTKPEVSKLHGLCGDILHQKPVSEFDPNKNWDYQESARWTNKIIALLNRHLIVLADKRRAIYVMMQTKETGQVTLMDLDMGDASHWPNWFADLQKEV